MAAAAVTCFAAEPSAQPIEAEEPAHVDWMQLAGDPSRVFDGLPCRLEALAGGVQCIIDGVVVQTLLHPSLFPGPRQYRERTDAVEPVGPVEFDGDFYYGLDNDLIRFDALERRIVERTRLPAPITAIADGDGVVAVTVEERYRHHVIDIGDPAPQVAEVVIEFDPRRGEAPGRGPWDWSGTLASLHDVMWLDEIDLDAEPGAVPGDSDRVDSQRSTAQMKKALRALRQREQLDSANPYLPLYRGEILQRMGESEQAARLFRRAVEYDHADWIDLARIGMRLEIRGKQGLADRAFERASRQMEAAGVRGEYISVMICATFALVWLHDAFGRAIDDGDTTTAHRVASHVDGLFPNLEGADFAWMRLAAFFDHQGQPELASQWRARSEQIRSAEGPERFFEKAAGAVDAMLMIQMGLFLTLLLSGLVLGLWRVEEDAVTASGAGEGDGPEWKEYVPRFYGGDLAMLIAVFAVLMALPMVVAPKVASMSTFADAPATISGDAIGAPSADRWIQGLSEGTARDVLAQESARELEATKSGTLSAGDVELDRLVREAIESDTQAREVRSFASVEASPAVLHELGWLRSLVESGFGKTQLTLSVVILVVIALVFGALFQAVARRFRRARRLALKVVPGAPNSLGFLRVAVLAVFVVGVLMLTPLNQVVYASTEAVLVGHFGLSDAPRQSLPVISTSGAALVGTAFLLHLVGIILDR